MNMERKVKKICEPDNDKTSLRTYLYPTRYPMMQQRKEQMMSYTSDQWRI